MAKQSAMLTDRARALSGWAGVLSRVAVRSGLAGHLNPRALAVGARMLIQGRAGLSAIFRLRGISDADRPALIHGGRARTFGEVDARIDRLATGLRRMGIGHRDPVAVLLWNRPEFFEVEAAMARLGGAAVSVSWRSTAAELVYLLNHAGAKAVLFEAALWPTLEAALRECPGLDPSRCVALGEAVPGTRPYEELLAEPAGPLPDVEEGAVVIYTSGTTGRPKGAVRRFGTAQTLGFMAFLERCPLTRWDRHLCVCPLYHSTALGFAGMTLMTGGAVVIERDFDAARFLETVEREHVTTTAIVPTMLHRLMALDPAVRDARRTPSLRAILCGGAAMPPALCQRALERFGPVLYNFYGATETGLVTTATPEDLAAAPGTVGRALHGVEVRLLDEGGTEVAPGAVGELYARNVMLVEGYHADDDATRASMRDGFFSVGDLATMDPAGRINIVGRRRDMVISGGVNIYPVEVEDVVAAHPDVSQVAVIGVPDEEWGERLRAFVVLQPGAVADADALKRWSKERLAGAKVPREWAFVDALPSNPTGKILKRELRDWTGDVVKA
jgi:fatty-acyl-CoA synthase